MSTKNVFRNVFPALVVMALGLGGAFFVYDVTNSNDDAAAVAAIAPAAGTESSTDAVLEIDYMGVEGTDTGMPTEEMAEDFTDAVNREIAVDPNVIAEETRGIIMDEETSAAEALQNITPAAGDHAHDAMDAAKEHAEDAAEAAEEHVEEAVEEAEEVTEDAQEAAEDAMEEAEDHVEDAAEEAEEHMDHAH